MAKPKAPAPKPKKKMPEYPNTKIGNYRSDIDTVGMAQEDKDFFFPKGKAGKKRGK